MPKAPLALFDFDGTLTRCDSLVFFLSARLGWGSLTLGMVPLAFQWLQYQWGRRARQSMKEAVLSRCLKGESFEELANFGSQFAASNLDRLLRKQALARVAWHQQQGHPCVLVSASLELYLKPWGKRHQFDEVIASRLEVCEGRVTGKLAGLNCWGPEKIRRVEEKYGSLSQYEIWAYGDSCGDAQLLAAAAHPFYKRLS